MSQTHALVPACLHHFAIAGANFGAGVDVFVHGFGSFILFQKSFYKFSWIPNCQRQ
jgi:hypothetical protein